MTTLAANNNKREAITPYGVRRFSRFVRNWQMYLLLVPVMLYYILFHYVPLYGIVIAFKKFNPIQGILGSEWVGLHYFKLMLFDETFWQVTRNTVIISSYKILFVFPAPIVLALMLNELISVRFKRIVQTIIYLPHFISWVIISGIIINFLSINGGLVNEILQLFGGKPVQFLAEPQYFRSILVISELWKSVGWGTIIYIAAMAGINSELYEAALVDGAGKWKQTLHVTLPGMMPTIIVMFILALSGILNAGFDQVFVLYNGAVLEVGDILDTYVFRSGIQQASYSFATAVGLFKGIIGLILILLADRLFKKIGENGIL